MAESLFLEFKFRNYVIVSLALPHNGQKSVQKCSPEVRDFLGSLVEFTSLAPEDLGALSLACRIEDVDSGAYLLVEGEDPHPYGFIVVTGRLAMIKTSKSGKELIVELLSAGDTFGILTKLIANKVPVQLSAKALQSSKVLWVPINNLTSILARYPDLYRELIAHSLLCLQSAYNLSRGLAHDRVEVRIASILVSLSLKFARPIKGDNRPTIYFTRQQLADLTGTTLETAIRGTREMEKKGFIDLSRPGIIKILNLAEIHLIAEA